MYYTPPKGNTMLCDMSNAASTVTICYRVSKDADIDLGMLE